MEIRKFDGEADGWLTAVALRSGTGWDDEDAPFQAVKGTQYYIKGEVDPLVFELVDKPKPPAKKVKDKEEGE